MKNTHIPNLLQEVPKDIRLEVYKEALDIISNNIRHESGSGFSLCLLLPCLLWDLDWYCNLAPDKDSWDWRDTTKAFPELTKDIITNIITYNNDNETKRNKIRINFLQDSIKLLS